MSALTADRPVASPTSDLARTPAWMRWAGRVLTALPVFALTMSAAMKLSHQPAFVAQWQGHLGFRGSSLSPIGALELACVVLFAIPQTAVLGALLLTAYLGGATATHVRLGEPFTAPVVLGALVWAALFFRDARVRALLPLRTAPSVA